MGVLRQTLSFYACLYQLADHRDNRARRDSGSSLSALGLSNIHLRLVPLKLVLWDRQLCTPSMTSINVLTWRDNPFMHEVMHKICEMMCIRGGGVWKSVASEDKLTNAIPEEMLGRTIPYRSGELASPVCP